MLTNGGGDGCGCDGSFYRIGETGGHRAEEGDHRLEVGDLHAVDFGRGSGKGGGGGGDGAVQPFWERKRRGDSVAKCGTSAGVVRLEDEAAAAGACFCVRGRCSGRWADRGIWVCLLLREENERAD
jgi:hypothetical protein